MNKQRLIYLALFFVILIAVLFFLGQFLIGQEKESLYGPENLSESESPSEPEEAADFVTVSVEEAREMIEKGEFFVLDVRTPAEFDESHIEGATLIPLENSYGSNLNPDQLLEARINEVPEEEMILVYCRSGRRSAAASQVLVDAGYTQVYNMDGGINEWISAGFPVVS